MTSRKIGALAMRWECDEGTALEIDAATRVDELFGAALREHRESVLLPLQAAHAAAAASAGLQADGEGTSAGPGVPAALGSAADVSASLACNPECLEPACLATCRLTQATTAAALSSARPAQATTAAALHSPLRRSRRERRKPECRQPECCDPTCSDERSRADSPEVIDPFDMFGNHDDFAAAFAAAPAPAAPTPGGVTFASLGVTRVRGGNDESEAWVEPASSECHEWEPEVEDDAASKLVGDVQGTSGPAGGTTGGADGAGAAHAGSGEPGGSGVASAAQGGDVSDGGDIDEEEDVGGFSDEEEDPLDRLGVYSITRL